MCSLPALETAANEVRIMSDKACEVQSHVSVNLAHTQRKQSALLPLYHWARGEATSENEFRVTSVNKLELVVTYQDG